jgi:hypothetical protein
VRGGAGGEAEALAGVLQALERALEPRRVGGREPRAEGQRASHRGAFAGDRGIALAVGLAVAAAPGHHELAFRSDEHLGPVLGAAQGGDVAGEAALALVPFAPLAQMQERRGRREDDEAGEDGGAHGVLRLEAARKREEVGADAGARGTCRNGRSDEGCR